MKTMLKTGGIVAAVLAAFLVASPSSAQKMKEPMGGMKGMVSGKAPVVPPVTGYSKGQTILFLHTEASDPKIAKILTDMMGSPVLIVPSLAKTPRGLRVPVFVFTNGVKVGGPMGPLGFQPDVFPSPPGTPGYTSLRNVTLVTWKKPASARVLKSASEVLTAQRKGEVAIKDSGIVVVMPMLTWPGGKR